MPMTKQKLWTVYQIVKQGELPYTRAGIYEMIKRGKLKTYMSEPLVIIRDSDLQEAKLLLANSKKWRAFNVKNT
jgi:hypothetical protein